MFVRNDFGKYYLFEKALFTKYFHLKNITQSIFNLKFILF